MSDTNSYARVMRFLLVGASGMLVDLAVFFLFLGALALRPSTALAIWLATT